MKTIFCYIAIFCILLFGQACSTQQPIEPATASQGPLPVVITNAADYNELSAEAARVLLEQGTERPGSSPLNHNKKAGIYLCAQCNQPLFRSADKFDSGCGWPSFDDQIDGAVEMRPDGMRTEIVCSNCKGHLGHVFKNEGFTSKNTRHCVNGLSLQFVPQQPITDKYPKGVVPIATHIEGKGYEKYSVATFAGGCFWCTEAAFERIQGVVAVYSGYAGGASSHPTYEQVSGGSTDHAESIMIYYDPMLVSYDDLLRIFFVAHDGTQLNRQGPDVGSQYRSAIFYHDKSQRIAARQYIEELSDSSGKIVTQLVPYENFWLAEDYHQDYYERNPNQPYVEKISRPKVEKVEKEFPTLLKEKYR